MAGQNFLTYSIQLADNLMLGSYQESALAAVSLCNQIQFLLHLIVAGLGEGVVIIGSQYYGRREQEPLLHLLGSALWLGGILATGLFALVEWFPGQILQLLTNDREIILQGVSYLRIVSFSYLLFALTNLIVIALRVTGQVKIGFILPLITLISNITLNYCLIYGHFGFKQMGIRGAAIATLISRCIELVILVGWLLKRYRWRGLSLKPLIRPGYGYVRSYRQITLPILANQIQWGFAQAVQTSILGHMGKAAIAANAIAVMVFQIMTVFVYGGAGAAGIIVGRTIGAGEEQRLPDQVKSFQLLFVGSGLMSAAAICLFGRWQLRLYNITWETRELAWSFLLVLAITSIGTAYQMSCDNGIIRGGGDAAFSVRMNMISMWLILLPLSALAAFYFHYSPVMVFFLLKWDQLYKSIPVAIRLHRYKWIRRWE